MIRLWIRTDGEPPKALAIDATKAPGPGLIVDVDARTAAQARALYALTQQAEPSESLDPQAWIEWRKAQRAVREVTA